MSEQVSQQNEEPLDNKDLVDTGSLVSDTEKAHLMAVASKEDEEAAAALRFVGNGALHLGSEGFQDAVSEAIENKENSEFVPTYYKEGLVHSQLDGNADVSVDALVERIEEHQQRADEDAKFAGDGYDKLQATKR